MRIVCEICGKIKKDGIMATDNGRHLRLFCSEKCFNKKLKDDEEAQKERKKSNWWY
jgi:hypothetical protein